MALRDLYLGDVLSFRACAREMTYGRLALVESRTAGSTLARIDGVCPVHDSDGCVETYLSARRLASWSLRDFWSWRSRRRGGDD